MDCWWCNDDFLVIAVHSAVNKGRKTFFWGGVFIWISELFLDFFFFFSWVKLPFLKSKPLLLCALPVEGVTWFHPYLLCTGHEQLLNVWYKQTNFPRIPTHRNPDPAFSWCWQWWQEVALQSRYVNEMEPSPKWPVETLIICGLTVLAKCKVPF